MFLSFQNECTCLVSRVLSKKLEQYWYIYHQRVQNESNWSLKGAVAVELVGHGADLWLLLATNILHPEYIGWLDFRACLLQPECQSTRVDVKALLYINKECGGLLGVFPFLHRSHFGQPPLCAWIKFLKAVCV